MEAPLNKITGANAGGPEQVPLRTRSAARIAQFRRWVSVWPIKTRTRLWTLAEHQFPSWVASLLRS
jgi:hypothetical protein